MTVKVQWQTQDNRVGISDIYVVDDERSVDYLYLMWPLTELITRAPGTVKFSVRFYRMLEGGKLAYSFATKVASATINSGHNFPMTGRDGVRDYEIDTSDSQFANSISNSRLVAEEDAPKPYFLIDLTDKFANGSTEANVEENWDYKNDAGTVIEAYIDADGNPAQILRVEAAGTGMIGYEWYYIDTLQTQGTELLGGKLYQLAPTIDYRVTADNDGPVDNKKYYIQSSSDGGEPEYTEISYADKPAGQPLYEKFNILKVENGQRDVNGEVLAHVVGKYYAKAYNYVGSNENFADSKVIVFPAPEQVEFATGGELAPNVYMTDGVGKITVHALEGERGAKFSYAWLYSESESGPFVDINDGSLASIRSKFSLNAEGNELTVRDQPGYFKVQLTSTRNFEPKTIESEGSCKVTALTPAPVVSPVGQSIAMNTYYNVGGAGQNIGAKLQVIVGGFAGEFESEKIKYQWYKTEAGDEAPVAIESAQGSGELPITGGTIVYNAAVQDTAAYYCVVTNKIGEMEKETRSATFVLSPWPEQNNPEPTPAANPVEIVGASIIPAATVESFAPGMSGNQNKVSISKNGNAYVIRKTSEEDLDEWISTDESMAELDAQKWIAVDIETNLSTITGATWDGEPIPADEIAISIDNLGEGHIIFWGRADALAAAPRVVEIGTTNGRPAATFTVSYTEE